MTATEAITKLREVVRRQHKALATEASYVHWLRRYMAALADMPPTLSREQKLEHFLTVHDAAWAVLLERGFLRMVASHHVITWIRHDIRINYHDVMLPEFWLHAVADDPHREGMRAVAIVREDVIIRTATREAVHDLAPGSGLHP